VQLKRPIMIDLIDLFKKHIEEEIRKGKIECQNENCDSRAFDVRVWENEGGLPEGAAVCRECNTRTNLKMQDSEIKEAQKKLDELDDALDDLQDAFDDF